MRGPDQKMSLDSLVKCLNDDSTGTTAGSTGASEVKLWI